MNLIKGDFLKSLVVLLSGTVIAQMLNVVFIPVLARIYSPEELGIFQFYLQIVTFLTAIVTLRLELSLPIEKHGNHRYILYRYAIRWAILFSLFVFVPILILVAIKDFDAIYNWMLVLIPVGVILHGFFNLGMYWELGSGGFSRITFAKLTQSISVNGLKLLAGIAQLGVLGLVASLIVGMMLSILVFFKSAKTAFATHVYSRKSKKTNFLLHKHRDFYYFNLPHTVVDLTRDLVLASFFLSVFKGHIFGSYGQAYIVLRLPLTFVGAAVGQALFAKCSDLVNEKKELFGIIWKVAIGLATVSIIPFVTIFFFGTEIFTFVLGPNWADAGAYSEIITWWAMIIFITSPFSILPVILNRQRSYFVINILRTLCLVGAIYIPYYLNPNIQFETSLGIIALAQITINFVLLVYFVYIVKSHDRHIAI